MAADTAALEKELRVAYKTIDKLKSIAIELKVDQKRNEKILEVLQTYKSDGRSDPANVLEEISQILQSDTATSSTSSITNVQDAGAQTDSLAPNPGSEGQEIGAESIRPARKIVARTISRFEVQIEAEPSTTSAPSSVMSKTPSRGVLEGRIFPPAPSPSEQSAGSNRLIEKLKLEASRFKEEALGARENLRVFAEVKEREIEEVRLRLEEAQRRLTMVQKKCRDDEDSIAFLESELNLKKAALDRAELSVRELQSQNEVLSEYKASTEKRLGQKDRLRLIRQKCGHIYLEGYEEDVVETKLASFPSEACLSLHIERSPDAHDTAAVEKEVKGASIVSESVSLAKQAEEISPIAKVTENEVLGDVTMESPTEKTTSHSATRTSSDQSLSTALAEREIELRKLESEKQQTVSMLRAKDLMIEKLHRRLKSMATNETLDGAISRMATREAKLEREVSKLKTKLEILERERNELKQKMTGEIINSRDWLYLRQTLPKFIQHFQKGETEMARALLPVVCSILRLSNDECVAILKSLSIPAPRWNV